MALATCRSVLRSPSRHIRAAFVVCAAYSDKPTRLGHLLPKTNGQRKSAASSPPAECEANYPVPVSQDQLVLAAQLLAQDDQGYDSDEELSIISSLDLDDVLQEANKLRWELSCPDLDTLRQYGPLLVGRSDDTGYGSGSDTSSTPDA